MLRDQYDRLDEQAGRPHSQPLSDKPSRPQAAYSITSVIIS